MQCFPSSLSSCVSWHLFPLSFFFLFPVTRGCDKKSRGWSISMFTGNMWQDLLGCDFVLDLIGEMEDVSNPSSPSQSSGGYPITPERDRNFFLNSAMDPWVTLSFCPKASGPVIQWPISLSSCCAFLIFALQQDSPCSRYPGPYLSTTKPASGVQQCPSRWALAWDCGKHWEDVPQPGNRSRGETRLDVEQRRAPLQNMTV